jgi:5'-3' exoribonuclease 2
VVALASHLLEPAAASRCASQPSKIIDDFIIMACMLGNDFMPRIPSGHCGDGAMDNLLETYIRCVLPHGFLTAPADQGSDIDMPALTRFLRGYAQLEAMLFRQQMCKSTDSAQYAKSGKFPTSLDESSWIATYRATTGFANAAARTAACKKYVEGLRFVWRYYSTTSSDCSWTWYYPFDYGPLACDLAEYTATVQDDTVRALPVQREAPEPFAQLLCILPPTSCRLLPVPLRQVMVKPPEDLQATFPTQWKVDESAAGGQEHLFTVCLPFANLERLQQVVKQHSASLADAERVRNTNLTVTRAYVRADHFNYSAPATAPDGTLRPAQFRWIRDAVVARSEPSVAVLEYTEPPAPRTLRPRGYEIASSRFLPPIPRSVLDPRSALPVQRRIRPNVSGLQPVDAIAVSVAAGAFSVMLAAPCDLALFVELIAVGVIAALILVFIGIGDSSPQGSAIYRNVTRDSMLDWLCPDCTCLNFGRNECCFVCERPLVESTCSAAFTAAVPRFPATMDPDHAKHTHSSGLEIPGWIFAAADPENGR